MTRHSDASLCQDVSFISNHLGFESPPVEEPGCSLSAFLNLLIQDRQENDKFLSGQS